jgi:nucleotide-binding universal stress UspA family protein
VGEEQGTVVLTEKYGPDWSPGPFERGTDGPRVILVGVDGSTTASRAGAYAAGLARRQHSRLVVVFVVAPSALGGIAAPAIAGAQEQAFADQIAEFREQLKARAAELGVPITYLVRRGDPYHELTHAAGDVRADLVVVGASEQAGHRFVGSIATRLVRAGRWPVTVVP